MADLKDCEWRKPEELERTGGDIMKLFEGEIEPQDVAQGAVGDCWLIAAFACLAEFPGAIQKVFVTREWNTRRKYQVRLYDGFHQRWETVTIDDRIPVEKGTNKAAFSKPNGNEMWVILLEKAFAKFCGSYANLDGGHTVWAWQAMTGDHVFFFKFLPDTKKWARMDISYPTKRHNKREVGFVQTEEQYDEKKIWEMIKRYDARKSVLAASITGAGGEVKHDNVGLVSGHAYSILKVREVKDFKLIKLRNPWGTFEWKGKWSDRSSDWKQYPDVAKAVDFKDEDDGSFWMEYGDFVKHFNRVQVCSRTTDEDLCLDVREESASAAQPLDASPAAWGSGAAAGGRASSSAARRATTRPFRGTEASVPAFGTEWIACKSFICETAFFLQYSECYSRTRSQVVNIRDTLSALEVVVLGLLTAIAAGVLE
eukprot:CAMPEP_0118945620 /NCGR_PEP_ID=MMETSP1169-20130426/42643_1 /TAXON_ID=36882 /ORGANISM="Pyramimonas obovata, Strain CCMP722" /LENGTH=425 /DNA_ID=CAMNT_0006891379 /DNA_START=199 /DNA_END=1477 /DNA_ORIENTATION=+